jgi:hypothetical protein
MKMIFRAAGTVGLLAFASPASAETTNCTNITTLPNTITVQGVYCLKQNLATSMASGAAITINTNNVTIDFNDFKLGGLAAGPATQATGVYARDRRNITLRNGNIRGFREGIRIDQTANGTLSSGHLIEDSLIDGSTQFGLVLSGSGIVARRNRLVGTDSTPPPAPTLQAAADSPLAGSSLGNSAVPGLSNRPAPQIGTGVGVNAILAVRLRNSQIVDNLITSTISSGAEAYGMYISESSNVEVARNRILNTRANTYAVGINVVNVVAGSAVLLKDNVAVTGVAATETAVGLEVTNGSVLCLNNTVSGYADAQTLGCTAEAGTFPVTP